MSESERVRGPDPRPRGPPGGRPGGRCERMRPLSYTSASKRAPDRRDPDDRIPPNTRQTRISHAHPTRPPARTAMESTTMDSSVQIVSLVYSMRRGPAAMQGLVLLRVRTCNTRAPVILAWRVLLRVRTCNTRAPVILAWRVLRGARRHTQGKGGAKPHPRERWGTSIETD